MVTTVEPNRVETGVAVTDRFAPDPPSTMFALGRRVGLEDVAARVKPAAAVSMSPMTNGMAAVEVFSLIVWFAISEMIGRSFAPATLTEKVRVTVLFWLWPSLTVTVIVAVPVALVVGRSVNVPV